MFGAIAASATVASQSVVAALPGILIAGVLPFAKLKG
jgi:hypothetical protein